MNTEKSYGTFKSRLDPVTSKSFSQLDPQRRDRAERTFDDVMNWNSNPTDANVQFAMYFAASIDLMTIPEAQEKYLFDPDQSLACRALAIPSSFSEELGKRILQGIFPDKPDNYINNNLFDVALRYVYHRHLTLFYSESYSEDNSETIGKFREYFKNKLEKENPDIFKKVNQIAAQYFQELLDRIDEEHPEETPADALEDSKESGQQYGFRVQKNFLLYRVLYHTLAFDSEKGIWMMQQALQEETDQGITDGLSLRYDFVKMLNKYDLDPSVLESDTQNT